TAASTLAAIDRLLDEYTDAQVAKHLNQQGYRTFDGLLFHSRHVSELRRHHGLADRYARWRSQGMLTAEELAHAYGVSAQTIWRWYRQRGCGSFFCTKEGDGKREENTRKERREHES